MDFKFSLVVFNILTFISLTRQEVFYSLEEEQGPDTYLGKVSEDADLRAKVQNASDFNSLQYSLLTSNPNARYFNINSRTSSLYTAQTLDRDEICAYSTSCILTFDVVAQVNNIFEKIKVSVELLDINDHAPTFLYQTLDLEIAEESDIGSSLTLSGAQDQDSGKNANISYTLLNQNTPFVIESGSYSDGRSLLKLIVNDKIDREIQGDYILTILAVDGADSPKNGTLTVNLKISDINDNKPKFEKSVYRISVHETEEAGTVILEVTASDPDEGENGQIVYSLSPFQSSEIKRLFMVNATTGGLIVTRSLIDEHNRDYRVIVEASDKGKSPLISQAEVFVNILDTHNKAPEITVKLLSQLDYIEKSEKTAVGTVLALMFARDPDTGNNGRIKCSISGDQFNLSSEKSNSNNNKEFNIILQRPLDRETAEWHTISISCQDSGSPPLNTTTNILLHVIDSNDNPPEFLKQFYTMSMPENGQVGVPILQVSARDRDIVDTGNIVYSMLVDLKHQNDFAIDTTNGVITVLNQLDRETSPQINIQVFAEDNGSPSLTGTAIVEINVRDKNDNAPEFTPGEFEFTVAENQPPNVSVGRVIAHDIDADINGKVSFSMAPNDRFRQIPFIVMQNGTILAEKSFDRETIDSYEFTVRAIDGGSPSLTSSANIKIYIQDVNDEAPLITFPSTDNDALTISYQTLPNTVIATIAARDRDDGENGKLFYSFQGTNSTSLFQLNTYTGQITLKKVLTLSHLGNYVIEIKVRDGGQPPKFDSRTLHISITDKILTGPLQDPEGGIKYFAIAIAIACVTIVLSIVIILAICLIRRRDNKHDKFVESVTTSSEADHANLDIKINGVYTRDSIQKSLTRSTGNELPNNYGPFKNSLTPKNRQSKPEILSDAIAIWDWADQDTTYSSETQRTQSTILPVHHSLQDLYNTGSLPNGTL